MLLFLISSLFIGRALTTTLTHSGLAGFIIIKMNNSFVNRVYNKNRLMDKHERKIFSEIKTKSDSRYYQMSIMNNLLPLKWKHTSLLALSSKETPKVKNQGNASICYNI